MNDVVDDDANVNKRETTKPRKPKVRSEGKERAAKKRSKGVLETVNESNKNKSKVDDTPPKYGSVPANKESKEQTTMVDEFDFVTTPGQASEHPVAPKVVLEAKTKPKKYVSASKKAAVSKAMERTKTRAAKKERDEKEQQKQGVKEEEERVVASKTASKRSTRTVELKKEVNQKKSEEEVVCQQEETEEEDDNNNSNNSNDDGDMGDEDFDVEDGLTTTSVEPKPVDVDTSLEIAGILKTIADKYSRSIEETKRHFRRTTEALSRRHNGLAVRQDKERMNLVSRQTRESRERMQGVRAKLKRALDELDDAMEQMEQQDEKNEREYEHLAKKQRMQRKKIEK